MFKPIKLLSGIKVISEILSCNSFIITFTVTAAAQLSINAKEMKMDKIFSNGGGMA